VARLYLDEIRQVALADNLAAALLEVAMRPDLCGQFHWAGTEAVSRWEMGRRIAQHFGVPDRFLEPIRRADTPEISARRPRDLTLDLAPLDRELRVKPMNLADAIAGLRAPPAFAAWLSSL
jgi:dTDP-4-dehydrorhamnose reductase